MSIINNSDHQVLINMNLKTKNYFDEYKKIMGTTGVFIVNRALKVQQKDINNINRKLYNYIKLNNYSDLFDKKNHDNYVLEFNYFYNTFINDENYQKFKIMYKDKSNQWITNYMQYLSLVISYSLENCREIILNLNE